MILLCLFDSTITSQWLDEFEKTLTGQLTHKWFLEKSGHHRAKQQQHKILHTGLLQNGLLYVKWVISEKLREVGQENEKNPLLQQMVVGGEVGSRRLVLHVNHSFDGSTKSSHNILIECAKPSNTRRGSSPKGRGKKKRNWAKFLLWWHEEELE